MKKPKLTKRSIIHDFKYDEVKVSLTMAEWEMLIRLLNRVQYTTDEMWIWSLATQLVMDHYSTERMKIGK